MRKPGPNAEVVIAYSGTVAAEAIAAAGLIGEDRGDVGLLAVTSADRLHAGWTAAAQVRDRQQSAAGGASHIETLLTVVPRNCALVSVIDGHPATLAWLGSVHGHRQRALGVDRFGQTGTIGDLYRHYGIDANAIIDAAQTLMRGRPIRHRKFAA
jgi:pyruvate dehydrogenase E1 component